MEASTLVGITEARDRLRDLIGEVKDHDVILLRHNRIEAVLVHPERLRNLEDRIEDLEDYVAILENRLEPEDKISHEEIKGVLQKERVSN